MHSLLNRQIRKHIPDALRNSDEIADFLKSVSSAYEDFDKKLSMIQRATAISSQELFEANRELEKEAEKQQNTIKALEDAINHLSENVKEKEFLGLGGQELNIEILANRMKDLASEVARISSDKDAILKNLEIRNTDLNNYAHMVSHDLRSPLRNISALMDWILEEDGANLSQPSMRNGQLVVQNLDKMDRLITGILQHATIGTTDEVVTTFELKDLIGEISSTILVPANIEIKVTHNGPSITFQRLRLEQLFSNLITNSIRATEHMEQGQIQISQEENEDYWAFTFTDNGKGIAKAHQSKIFEMFRKLENDGSTTGIGLALVKKIVQHHQGVLRLESEVDKGTTIYFTLKKELK
ncbi:MAG: GHKL domain-containing protein [Allomuricauda sp.]|nr:MAG: GHKL domain-containing protein [Allomuricauda sp.]